MTILCVYINLCHILLFIWISSYWSFNSIVFLEVEIWVGIQKIVKQVIRICIFPKVKQRPFVPSIATTVFFCFTQILSIILTYFLRKLEFTELIVWEETAVADSINVKTVLANKLLRSNWVGHKRHSDYSKCI